MLFAIIFGTLAASLFLTGIIILEAFIKGFAHRNGANSILFEAIRVWALAVIIAFGGIAVVGVPAWAALHFLGYRSWYAGASLGASMTGAVFLITGGASDSRSIFYFFALTSSGGIVGWLIWKIAYFKEVPTAKADQT